MHVQNSPLHNCVHNPLSLRPESGRQIPNLVRNEHPGVPLCLHGLHDDLPRSYAHLLDLLHRLVLRCRQHLIQTGQTFL